MRRDRILSILKYLHFPDNEAAVTGDRLAKIQNILQIIIDSFKNSVKFGNILLQIYSKSDKRHKYGIKFYKLCLTESYTYNLEIYSGKTVNAATKGMHKTL